MFAVKWVGFGKGKGSMEGGEGKREGEEEGGKGLRTCARPRYLHVLRRVGACVIKKGNDGSRGPVKTCV